MVKILAETVSGPELAVIDETPVIASVMGTASADEPIAENKVSVPPILESLSSMTSRSIMSKPVYADSWTVGNKDSLELIESYETEYAEVNVGTAPDGEIEYNIVPNEYSYPSSMGTIVEETIESVRDSYRRTGGMLSASRVMPEIEDQLRSREEEISSLISPQCSIDDAIAELSHVVLRYTLGLGVFDILLNDPRLEDIYIDAPCRKNRIHVTLNQVDGMNSHVRCRTNLLADEREVKNLINILMKESGLPYCESNPVLETNMADDVARATIVGYPMSPNGDSVAIRKHATVPWTLTRLIGNGTIDARTAGLLSFLINNRSTFLICGARGAGKSSLLSSMLFEFPVSQRILTIEDTLELPGEKMRSMGYKVQSMLVDERIGRDAEKRADEALRVSLRLGESAIVLGEVRGEEAKTLYQSMRTGRAGSSIMGTIHGDCAKTVYDRVVHDLDITPESFKATDFLITLGTQRDRGSGRQIRRMNEFVSTSSRHGTFIDITNNSGLFKSPAMKRIMTETGMTYDEILNEIDIRARLRESIAETAKEKGEGYYGPEWIVLANDHLSRNISAGVTDADAIVESFRDRFTEFKV